MSRAPYFVPVLVVLAAFSWATGVSAQAKRGRATTVIEIKETTVVGRVQKPVAAQEIGKMTPRLQSNEPKKSFLDRIEGATSAAPF